MIFYNYSLSCGRNQKYKTKFNDIWYDLLHCEILDTFKHFLAKFYMVCMVKNISFSFDSFFQTLLIMVLTDQNWTHTCFLTNTRPFALPQVIGAMNDAYKKFFRPSTQTTRQEILSYTMSYRNTIQGMSSADEDLDKELSKRNIW